MRRTVKNIITVTLLVLAIAGLCFTSFYIGMGLNSTHSNPFGEFTAHQNGGTPPEMPSGDLGGNMAEPPEMPNGDQGGSMGQPPEMPNGNQGGNMAEPPEKPDGEQSGNAAAPPKMPNENQGGSVGQPPEMPNGNQVSNMTEQPSQSISVLHYALFGAESLIISMLALYLIMSQFHKKTFRETFSEKSKIAIAVLLIVLLTAVLTFTAGFITPKFAQSKGEQGGAPGFDSMQGASVTYTSPNEMTEDKSVNGEAYSSSKADENAVLISDGAKVTLNGITATKTGDSDGGDNTSFYGINSAIMVKDGANVTVQNATVATDATGANGVFSYGGSATTNNVASDGTTVNISDSKITTKKDNSGGIMTTGGGVMNASNLTVETAGTSSAAIRTDRGGGTVNVTGGSYTTAGIGSPAIYSTANISVADAELVAKASEGVIIEGKNSVKLSNVELTDSNTKLNGLSTTYKNIFLYQSMSGDASVGNAEFTAENSRITTNNGDTFYITNTTAAIYLTGNTFVNNDAEGCFLRAQKDSWGNSGSNGGQVTMTMTKQNAAGNIVIDSLSTLTLILNDSSCYEGAINTANEAKEITLKLDATSKIKLTGDCYVTSLENSAADNSNIDLNGYTLYVNGVAIS